MRPELDRRLRAARAALAEPGREREDRAVARALAGRRGRRGAHTGLVAALVVVSLTISLAALAGGSAPQLPGSTAATAVRVVDRTFSCLPARSYETAGMREFGFAVTKRTRSMFGHWEPASVVLDGGSPSSARSKFLIVHGHESRNALQAPGGMGPGLGGVYVNRSSCAPSRASVPLSARGLPGPAVRYATGTGCEAPGRILIRVRATLVAPARWRTISELFSGVQRNVTEMAVAVRAERTSAPLVYAQARASSTALWRADRCR